jgi:hypothetical protein
MYGFCEFGIKHSNSPKACNFLNELINTTFPTDTLCHVGGWIILGWILERWDGAMWTGLVWLRIGKGGELL